MGNDPQPGQRVAVVVQGRGSRGPEPRGEIVIEDLRDVVTRTSFRFGANGPQGPVTQYILSQAVEHLDTQLTDDALPRDEREPIPRLLSALLGHESFVVNVLGLSPHNMRRRWPLATDWYADLVAYILRPTRFDLNRATAMSEFAAWLAEPLGECLQRFAQNQLAACRSPYIRLGEMLSTLWPDYPPVIRARRLEYEWVAANWSPVYAAMMRHYGLRLRPDTRLGVIAWMADALVMAESKYRPHHPGAAPQHSGGEVASWTGEAALLMIAGAAENLDGTTPTLTELRIREPAGDPWVLLAALSRHAGREA